MGGFGGRDDAFGAGEKDAGFEGFELGNVGGFDEAVFEQLADEGARAVVAQSAGVDVGGFEVVAEGVHRQEGCQPDSVPEVVAESAAREFRTGFGFDGDDAEVFPVAQFAAEKGEGNACEVGASAEAADDDVGFGAGFFHLEECLFADDSLMEQHVVEDAADGVVGFGIFRSHLDGFGYGDAEAAGGVGVPVEDAPSGFGQFAGGGNDVGSPRVHHEFAVGLLVITDFDHEDFEVYAEVAGGKAQGGTPLSSAGFGGEVFDALAMVVVCLRDGGVGFMGACHAGALVLEVDAGGGVESFFQCPGTNEGGRPPYFVEVLYFFGDIDESFAGEFLIDEFFGENGKEVFLGCRFPCGGVQGWKGLDGHVRCDVVPCRGHFFFTQGDFLVGFHDVLFYVLVG